MKENNTKFFILFYLFLLLVELITGSYTSLQTVHYYIKPTLLFALLFFFWKQSNNLKAKTRMLMYLALFFSLLGDVLLLFADQSSHYFMGGLAAFLLAHVFYVVVFLQKRNSKKNPIYFILMLLIYAVILFCFLYKGLDQMLIPVLFYMLTILTMSTAAYLRKGSVHKISYNLVLLGAVLFMVSDSILALNKFYKPLAFSHVSIMFTYAIAQLCIVLGMLKQR